jgi:hypothetical protein
MAKGADEDLAALEYQTVMVKSEPGSTAGTVHAYCPVLTTSMAT